MEVFVTRSASYWVCSQRPWPVAQSLSAPRRTPSEKENPMLTLYLRYTFDPNKRPAYEAYVAAEMEPITRSGGNIIGYFLPTDYAGPTNEAHGLIEFPSLASYEQYRHILAADTAHKENNSKLESSGAIISIVRSIVKRA
jgi:hypothetical protein